MVFCTYCRKIVKQVSDGSSTYCEECGKVFDTCVFSDDVTFIKGPGGTTQMSGNYVHSIKNDTKESTERTLDRAYYGIMHLKDRLNMGENLDDLVNEALAFYRIALDKKFTRGRKREYVEASCLYIACRIRNKPYLLIDFSIELMTNVYVLGAVFLQLCKALHLNEHDIVQKPIDPSLFIYKYTYNLCGKNKHVEQTALQIIASMKRDWMQTGRKPSGLCGAAIYISALSHGLKYSKSDIVRVVHICEATLTKRLVEFENTQSGSLTIEEFIVKATEIQESSKSEQSSFASKSSDGHDLLCKHKDRERYSGGLCEACYNELMEISGGFEGGSDPPAFQRAEKQRMKQSKEPGEVLDVSYGDNEEQSHYEQSNADVGSATMLKHDYGEFGKSHETNDGNTKSVDESDSLSDIDDVEVDGYLHTEEEKHYKKIIWEEMNREYLEEQAAKEAAAAAAREACAANFKNCAEDLQAAQKIAAAAAAAVANSRKERQQKRAAEAKSSVPAQSAAEATRQMLTKKRLSSKINYDVLEELFDDSVGSDNPKKTRIDSPSQNEEKMSNSKKMTHKSEDGYEDGDLDPENEINDDGDIGETYDDTYYDNIDEAYDFDDEYGYDIL